MEITTDEVVSVSNLVRNLGQYLDRLKSRRLSKLLVSRQSGLEAVVLPLRDYEDLLEGREQLDHLLLYQDLRDREKKDTGRRISREKLKKKYGLDD